MPYLRSEALAEPVHDRFIVPGATIRHGDWKLLVKAQKPGGSKADTVGKTDRVGAEAGSLFDLRHDVGETTDVSQQHPERVSALTEQMKAFQAELKKNSRPIGRIAEVPRDVKRKLERTKGK